MRHEEAKSQRALVKWWAFACKSFGVPEHLLVSFPNGGKRGIREAVLIKKEGCRRGAPDLILLVPRGSYHGMAIEMKAQGGKLSPDQFIFMRDLYLQGYWPVVSYGTEFAIDEITKYLNQKPITSVTFSTSRQVLPASRSRRTRQPRVPVSPQESSGQPEPQDFCEGHQDA